MSDYNPPFRSRRQRARASETETISGLTICKHCGKRAFDDEFGDSCPFCETEVDLPVDFSTEFTPSHERYGKSFSPYVRGDIGIPSSPLGHIIPRDDVSEIERRRPIPPPTPRMERRVWKSRHIQEAPLFVAPSISKQKRDVLVGKMKDEDRTPRGMRKAFEQVLLKSHGYDHEPDAWVRLDKLKYNNGVWKYSGTIGIRDRVTKRVSGIASDTEIVDGRINPCHYRKNPLEGCRICGGSLMQLGKLGSKIQYRCNDCNMEFSDIEPRNFDSYFNEMHEEQKPQAWEEEKQRMAEGTAINPEIDILYEDNPCSTKRKRRRFNP